MKKNIWQILLGLIVLLGLFLRIYKIDSSFNFEGELGKELLYLRQYYLAGKLPLIGMTTSHEWLHYGPFYYWIMMPLYVIFNGNPFILFWAAIAASALGFIFNYQVVSKIVNKKIAIFSTFIQAISPILIWQTRNAKLHTLFFILSPLFMYTLWKVWNGNRKAVFWAGITFGFMFSFHFSQIPLLGVVILLFWIKKNLYIWRDWLVFGFGVLIPNITYIFSNFKILIWLPYRVLNIADKDTDGTLLSLINYFGRNLFWNNKFWVFGFLIFIVVFTHYIYENRNDFKKEFLPFYLISSISIMLVANIIHGAPPIHYFLPIFTSVPILYSIYFNKIKWGLLLFILIFIINLPGYFNPEKPTNFISYQKINAASEFIVNNARDKSFFIKRIGPYDYFPDNYSQNYKYLIQWMGGKLDTKSVNVYTIIENDGEINVQK